MLNKGDRAPDIESIDQDGNSLSLKNLLESGPVVLYFYPADFTPICTAQACAFRDRADNLSEHRIRILGISPQGADSHRRFADSFQLTFPLISDEKKQIIRAYGVDGPLGFGVRRATFLVGQDQRIGKRVVSDLFVGSHTDFLASVLKEIDAPGSDGRVS
ncbi:MAG: peroxiredoxin [Pseudomonadota bacterium]